MWPFTGSLNTAGALWRSAFHDTGLTFHLGGRLPLAIPKVPEAKASQGTSFIKHWCLGSGISSSIYMVTIFWWQKY